MFNPATLSPSDQKSYFQGLAIVNRKLAAYRAIRPTAEMISAKAIKDGKEIIRKRLAAASQPKALATPQRSTPSQPSTPRIDFTAFRKVAYEAARIAAREVSKPSKAASSTPAPSTPRQRYNASGRVKHLCSGGGLFA